MPLLPSLSVVVRTVNRPQLLAECLDSLLAQTPEVPEIVVVDMSAGAARDVLLRAKARAPTLVALDTGGRRLSRPVAANRGVEASRGEVVALLDDDDLWDPPHAARLRARFAQTGADLVYAASRHRTFTPGGVLVHETVVPPRLEPDTLVAENTLYTSATAWTRTLYDRVGGFDPRFPVYEDWDFLVRAVPLARTAPLAEPSSVSRSHTGRPGLAGHSAREHRACRRCLVGLHWTHRGLLSPAWFEHHAELVATRYGHLPRRGVLRRDLRRLAGWWVRGVFARAGVRR